MHYMAMCKIQWTILNPGCPMRRHGGQTLIDVKTGSKRQPVISIPLSSMLPTNQLCQKRTKDDENEIYMQHQLCLDTPLLYNARQEGNQKPRYNTTQDGT